MEIAVVHNKYFNLGVMGRSGSRSLLFDLTGISKHNSFMCSFEKYNENNFIRNPNILVLRHPIERAKSGSKLNLQSKFHGMPFLHKVNYEKITHIIKFEDLKDYVKIHKGKQDYIFTDDMSQYRPWKLEDFDYDKELNLYKKFLEKPILEVEHYKLLKEQII